MRDLYVSRPVCVEAERVLVPEIIERGNGLHWAAAPGDFKVYQAGTLVDVLKPYEFHKQFEQVPDAERITRPHAA